MSSVDLGVAVHLLTFFNQVYNISTKFDVLELKELGELKIYIFTPHAQCVWGKVIGVGVVYMYMMFVDQKKI